MENNFKNNNGGYKFNNNFQPQAAAAQPVVAEVEAPKAGFVKTATTKVSNTVKNLPKPAKAGLAVVVGVVTIWAVDKFALNGRIKRVLGFGKKKNEEETAEGEFEETK